jgi:hypothetical protein
MGIEHGFQAPTRRKIKCWIDGDRCAGCLHYYGREDHCRYRPDTVKGRMVHWLTGRCGFKEIFIR